MHSHRQKDANRREVPKLPRAAPRDCAPFRLIYCHSCCHCWLQAAHQRAGVAFLRHDVRTEHDDVSDLARLYRVRATPSFVFLVGGAKVTA